MLHVNFFVVDTDGLIIGAQVEDLITKKSVFGYKDTFKQLCGKQIENACVTREGVLRSKPGHKIKRITESVWNDNLRKKSSAIAVSYKCPTLTMADLEKRLRTENVISADGKQRHRYLKKDVDKFCDSPTDRILGIYGLRRTGKSVLMRSKALELMKQKKSVVYFDFEFDKQAKFSDLIDDLKLCKERGVQYVFIDEITFIRKPVVAGLTGNQFRVPEFPLRGNEVYANLSAYGVHVIVSGTDSYCLSLAKGDVLYDRMTLLHTTHIPYREYVYLTKRADVLKYIHNGGILQREEMVEWEEYINTAIIDNVIYSIGSLRTVTSKYRFLRLRDDEIRQLILYTMMVTNIEFFEYMFEPLYKFPDLTDSEANLRRRTENPITFPSDFIDAIKKRIQHELHIKLIDAAELNFYYAEIEEILIKLDLITPHKLHLVTSSRKNPKLSVDVYALSVPGLRTYQLMKTLWSVEAEINDTVSVEHKDELLKNIRQSAEGHKVEGIVLSEVVRSLPKGYTASQYKIFGNEADMVIENTVTNEVCLFEIKRSSELVENQAKHFLATSFVGDFMAQYPDKTIKSLNVLYNGDTKIKHRFSGAAKDVNFIGFADFLTNLQKWIRDWL